MAYTPNNTNGYKTKGGLVVVDLRGPDEDDLIWGFIVSAKNKKIPTVWHNKSGRACSDWDLRRNPLADLLNLENAQ